MSPDTAPSRLRPWSRSARVLDLVVVVIALVQIARVAAAVSMRMTYPFELEWMEGGIVDHVRRVLDGQPLYQAPSVTFTPYIYTPFYYAVSAAVCDVVGVGPIGPRLVSVAAALGSFSLIASFVIRESRSRIAAILACGWFASTYALTGYWLDLARVDSLFLFLVLTCLWLARFGRSPASAVGAGLTLSLAFFSKQAALPFLLPAAAFCFVHGWRRATICVASSVVPTVVAVSVANHLTGGWFGYYVFDVPGQHAMLWDRWLAHLLAFFVTPVAALLVLALLLLVSRPSFIRPRRKLVAYFAWISTAAVGSFTALLHRDGFVNVLMPFYASLAVVASLGFAGIRQRVCHGEEPRIVKACALVGLLWLVAFAMIDNPVEEAIPTDADRRAARDTIETLRDQPRPLWMPGSGFYASTAGHAGMSAHTMALADVFKTREAEPKGRLLAEVLASIHDRRWAAVVLDPSFVLLPPQIEQTVRQSYRLERRVLPERADDDGWPPTGFRNRAEEIWVPRERAGP